MNRVPRRDILRIAFALSDGAPIQWEDEQAAQPELRAELQAFRAVECVARAHRSSGSRDPESFGESGMVERLRSAVGQRYTIKRVLGQGGMATVFLADDHKHRRPVAIKMLNAEAGAAWGSRWFAQEIETVASLQHPHILPLFDSGLADGVPYFVMAFADGESLRDRLKREHHLPLDDALRIARETADALSYAHDRGVVHRDIKPENILILGGHAVVSDFGIARVETAEGSNETTTSGIVVGTPTYMSPEQAMGQPIDRRSDIYSLGCVVYEMLTGDPPLRGPSSTAIRYLHAAETPTSLQDVMDGVPDSIARAVQRALAKNSSDRFETAMEFAGALTTEIGIFQEPWNLNRRPPNNLPAQSTSFVGRTREIIECSRYVSSERLLTLTGPGGCGKTRLALRLGEREAIDGCEGIWFVDLSQVAEPTRLHGAIASALGVSDEPERTLIESIANSIGQRRIFLILDNLEHLLAAAAESIARLLAACPALRVLATSREPTRLDVERVVAIAPLSIIGPGKPTDVAAVRASESGRLFVDRFMHAQPGFTLAEDNAGVVAEICRRLDGIPLAIELAAARGRVISIEEIHTRLDQRFRLLTSGTLTVLPRHRTLRAMIEWSYELLTAPEQRLFRALAVFSGGWLLEAATAVLGDDEDEYDVLDLMAGLVDKSLVVVSGVEGGRSRYRYLETMRALAIEKLEADPEAGAVRRRHTAFFGALASEAASHLTGATQAEWLARLDGDRENFNAALSETADTDVELRLQMSISLWRYWFTRGQLKLARTQLESALEQAGAAATSLRAEASYRAGMLAYHQADYASARHLMESSIELYRRLEDKSGLARVLTGLGHVANDLGDYASAIVQYRQSLELHERSCDSAGIAHALNGLGVAAERQGESQAALDFYLRSLEHFQALGDAEVQASLWTNVVTMRIRLGQLAEARDGLLECFELVQRIESWRSGAFAFAATMEWEVERRRPDRAARLAGIVDNVKATIGLPMGPVERACYDRLVAHIAEALGTTKYAELRAEGGALAFEAAITYAVEGLVGAS